jgi:hypothetical protein
MGKKDMVTPPLEGPDADILVTLATDLSHPMGQMHAEDSLRAFIGMEGYMDRKVFHNTHVHRNESQDEHPFQMRSYGCN